MPIFGKVEVGFLKINGKPKETFENIEDEYDNLRSSSKLYERRIRQSMYYSGISYPNSQAEPLKRLPN